MPTPDELKVILAAFGPLLEKQRAKEDPLHELKELLTLTLPFQTEFFDGSTKLENAAFEKLAAAIVKSDTIDDVLYREYLAITLAQRARAEQILQDMEHSIQVVLKNLPAQRKAFELIFADCRDDRNKRDLGIPQKNHKPNLRTVT